MSEENTIVLAKILIIDDSEFSRKSISAALVDAGVNVVGTAGSAKEAAEILKANDANLLIIDIVMPDMNGIELAKQYKEKFPDKYVILISSLSHEHIILDAISSGASDFLRKPFRKEDLLASIHKISQQIKEDQSMLI